MHSFESPRYLLKWVLISTLIGMIAGIGAIAFYAAIHLATELFLGRVVGYLPPDPAGEGQTTMMPLWAAARPWLLPIITTAGGLVAGIIVFSLAPEAEGHGTDAAIAAFHQGKAVRARIPLVKLVASAITIGTGGSAGREGPAAQISAGFGSLLATLLHLDVQDRRIALATGIGAGIGAIFRAPLGGAILAAEILYKSDLEVEALIPGLIASIVGYSIFGAWSGWSPIFEVPANLAFSSPPQLLYYVLLGILCGGIGWLYAHGFYGITHLFHRFHVPNWIKPGIGGLLVGLIGLFLPQALGMGYGWVQVSMGQQGLLAIPLWVILLLPFAKILTTGLSIGSGGSGGIFGPGMVIGGMTGALVWRLTYHVLPGVPPTPAPFVIVGMMALFGGVAHAPLAVMLMVAEMTANLSMLAPAMIAVSLSYLLVGQTTIYTSQLETRADSPAHRLQFSFPLLSTLAVRQAMAPVRLSVRETQTVAEAAALLASQRLPGAPVLNERAGLVGVLTHTDIERVSEARRSEWSVAKAMNRKVLTIHADASLDEALEELTTGRVHWAPVVEAQTLPQNRQVLGIVSVADIVQLYRKTLSKDTHRMRGLVEGTVMQEVVATPEMPFVGRTLREAALPAGCLVVSIRRGPELLFPNGGMIIKPGDTVTVLMSPQGEARWQDYMNPQVAQNGSALTSSALSAPPGRTQ
jgi:CIC family chloride channel protein